MKNAFFIFIILSFSQPTQAQTFSRLNLSIIPTAQILTENYFVINLPPELSTDSKVNQFDANNFDTHLQLLSDNNGRKYHILLQTNFAGGVIFLAISNNLSSIFNNREKPLFSFNNCIRELNTTMSSRQNIEAVINCILKRLEYCSN